VSDVGRVLRAHLAPTDPLHSYARRLGDPALDGTLRGYLNGSLDLVFALPDGRYVVADYKTNRLGPPEEPLTAWHYRPEALDRAMADAHYPLQALLYVVALHRYLRWRLPGYDPSVNLGGALYLFVRGMSAPRPVRVGRQPCGVWSWAPSPALVEALSELFDRGAETGR
jgi:exodeoxyribonuclease V beta subunit